MRHMYLPPFFHPDFVGVWEAYALVDSSAFDERLATFPQSKSRGMDLRTATFIKMFRRLLGWRFKCEIYHIYIYIHLFASIFKISKAGTSCFCVSTGVAYFFESSERYSIELVSSKSPCFLQRFRWGRHNHTPATETYS